MPEQTMDKLPQIFRLTGLQHKQVSEREFRYDATIFHEHASMRVCWSSCHLDIRLYKGALVSPRWAVNPVSIDGAIRINRLVLIEVPIPAFCLFDTVPSLWVKDRLLVEKAAELFGWLPREFQYLLNAIFWEGRRFHRFLVGPSSLNGHHPDLNGNFKHTLEVVDLSLSLVKADLITSRSVLVTAAILHDAGKADEYKFDHKRNCFTISERGALIGHRHTILEWIAVAIAKNRINIRESDLIAILHCLTAAKGGEFLGIRKPMSIEAQILSSADRISGHTDLIYQNRPDSEGFGRFHKHLGGRPFVSSNDEKVSVSLAR